MKKNINLVISMNINLTLLLTVLLMASCQKEPSDNTGHGGGQIGESSELAIVPFHKLNAGEQKINSHKDEWGRSSLKKDYRSYIELGAENNVIKPTYTRMCTLSDGTYMLTWQNAVGTNGNGQDTFYATSKDLVNWDYRGYLWKSYSVTNGLGNKDTRRFTNANVIQLSNGELLAVAAFSTVKTYSKYEYRNEQGLIIKKSRDGGVMWYGEKEIYHGPCWEAHLMELPDGEIQCFFSESRPWTSGSHSGTVMVYSKDGGNTWSPDLGNDAYRVMRKEWWNEPKKMWCYTYQMPVGVILNESHQFAFAMESANMRVVKPDGSTSDQFSIAMVFSKPDGKWEYLTEEHQVTPREQRIDSLCPRGAAPYLVQFPSGETLLAFGNTKSKQIFRLGNATATEFGPEFNGLPEIGSWGGLNLTSSHSVISCMRNSRDGAEDAKISIARYNLNHSIKAASRTAGVDGDNSDWPASDEALFIGEMSQAQSTMRVSADSENYYFLIETLDKTLSASDFGYLMIAPDEGTDKITSKARRVRFGLDGIKSTDQYAGGWRPLAFGAEGKAAYEGSVDMNKDEDNGFVFELKIPKNAVSSDSGKILVNLGYYDAVSNSEDSIGGTGDTSKWMYVKF